MIEGIVEISEQPNLWPAIHIREESSMERKITKKSQYWQIVRGICILAVIMIHCASDQNYTDLDYTVWIVLRQFINFPLQCLFFWQAIS